MKPVIALVGRPNVGKSTLFNQLTRSRDALVADLPGLTRDRKYGDALLEGRSFIVIDTGGIGEKEGGVDAAMADQSRLAMIEADIVLFLVDGRAGLTASDQDIAEEIRRLDKPAHLVINKTDGLDPQVAAAEFHVLGMGQPFTIAAAHGRGVLSMIQTVLDVAGVDEAEQEALPSDEEGGIRIAIVGRPNVGKSTLVNRMLGEERVVVYDMPGTTRDSIYIPFEHHGQRYTLIDTAGVRRRGKVNETVEKFSVIKTLQAIKDAQVVIMVLDARDGVVDQDLHLLGFILETGRALVIALNKWDGMRLDERDTVRRDIDRKFEFVRHVRTHFISALHGTAVGDLYGSVKRAYRSAMTRTSASRLTEILASAQQQHQPPLINGRRIKLRYAHMGGQNPPLFVIHGNQTEHIPADYRRYLENTFRSVLKLEGTPVHLEFRTSDNPFEGRKNELTERQIQKKRRMVAYHKKRESKKKR